MAVMKGNGGVLPEDNNNNIKGGEDNEDVVIRLKGVLNNLIGDGLLDLDHTTKYKSKSERWMDKSALLLTRMDAARRDLLLWSRQGDTPLRPILLLSAGTVTVLALTGVLVFTLLFVAATVNAIVISLLISLAAVGGFLAIFFACFTVMYVGVLFVAAFVTFTVTIMSIMAALVTAGWIGFIWITWSAVSKGATLAKRFISKPPTPDTSSHDSSKEPVDRSN